MEDRKTNNFLSLRIRWAGFLGAFGFFVGAVSLVGFLSPFHWAFDLLCHFRFQYALSLSLVTLAFVIMRRWKSAALCGLVATINIATVVPLFIPVDTSVPSSGKIREALHINVDRARGNKEAVRKLIEERDPDLLQLCEISYAWMNELEDLLERYPFRVVEERQDNFGIGLFSKHSFEKALITRIGPADVPSCLAIVQLPEATVTVIGTHPIPPGGQRRSMLRDSQLESLAAGIRKATPPVILMGDLNVSPWSSHFQDLLKVSGLRAG
ncbi:MAG: endonuclease/exonuclease/phosphatase family protein, partial [Candidatus Omnitrophica bacterium]|nr:endonuclease/exonuclease/phosphatase family protein [Candidatus Omnitrophota bacterium]